MQRQIDMQQQTPPSHPDTQADILDDDIQVISDAVKPSTRICKITGRNSYICEIRTKANETFAGVLLKNTKPNKVSKSTQTLGKDLEHSDASSQTETEISERTKPLEEFKRPSTPIPTSIVRPKRKRK